MAITTYTSYAEVRAALGVSETELPDSILALPMYETLVVTDIESVYIGIPAKFIELSALLSRSATEQRFVDLTRLFASYTLAQTLLTSLPLFAVKHLTDGRAGFDRQTDIYADARDGVQGMYNKVKSRVAASYKVIEPSVEGYIAGSFAYATNATLGTDPVTNA